MIESAFGMIGTADERAGRYLLKPHGKGILSQPVEFLRPVKLLYREGRLVRLQVLSHGQDIAGYLPEVAQDRSDFFDPLSQPQHEACLGDYSPGFRPFQKFQ